MKEIFESVIKKGGYDLADMLKKIDSYHVEGKLTDADRDYLYSIARGSADPTVSVDVMEKLMDLDARVTALENGGSKEPTTDIQEYVPGKWYRAGDRVMFEGKVYICTAPEGSVCTWSPAEYPAYWTEE